MIPHRAVTWPRGRDARRPPRPRPAPKAALGACRPDDLGSPFVRPGVTLRAGRRRRARTALGVAAGLVLATLGAGGPAFAATPAQASPAAASPATASPAAASPAPAMSVANADPATATQAASGPRSLRFGGSGAAAPGADRVLIPVDPPTTADLGATDFTIELWMAATAADNPGASRDLRRRRLHVDDGTRTGRP